MLIDHLPSIGSGLAGATFAVNVPIDDFLIKCLLGIIVGVSVWAVTTGLKYLFLRFKK
jgi:hypothetical protein